MMNKFMSNLLLTLVVIAVMCITGYAIATLFDYSQRPTQPTVLIDIPTSYTMEQLAQQEEANG